MPDPEIDAMNAIAESFATLDDQDARTRVLEWAAAKFGGGSRIRVGGAAREEDSGQSDDEHASTASVGRNARRWLHQNAIDPATLEEVFHIENERVQYIGAHLPGKSNREKTQSAYLIAGAMGLLQTDEPNYSDESARGLCIEYSCYDTNNHASTLKSIANTFVGSKKDGYRLTAPGLRSAAKIVKAAAERTFDE